MSSKYRFWGNLNSETGKKFELKYPNIPLNLWTKKLVVDILDERYVVLNSSDLKVKDLEIANLKLQVELLEEKLDKMREKVLPISTAHVAIGDKDAGS